MRKIKEHGKCTVPRYKFTRMRIHIYYLREFKILFEGLTLIKNN
jgi:hypothetical protein